MSGRREWPDERRSDVVLCQCRNLAGDCDGAHNFAQWLVAMIARGRDNS